MIDKKIDCLVFKMYAFDADYLSNEFIKHYPNSIIVLFDFEKIYIHYQSPKIRRNKKTVYFLKNRSKKYWFLSKPVLFFYNIVSILWLMTKLMLQFRPKICWVEDPSVAFWVGLLRKMGFCKKSIYIPGDWQVNQKHKNSLSRFANNLYFPFMDLISCRLNTIVLDHTRKITLAREQFWVNKKFNNVKLYPHPLNSIKLYPESIGAMAKGPDPDKIRKKICFIGQLRYDSGLDIAISSLPLLRKNEDISLLIIGPRTLQYDYFKTLSKELQIEDFVHFTGFLQNKDLIPFFDECFCGLNLLTNKNSYSSFTLPGKIMHYLQSLVPVIATNGIGSSARVLEEKNMGLIIEPTQEDFIKAVCEVFKKQRQFRLQIADFFRSLPELTVKEFIETL
jgi:glycosyltransferase involved in cell wall biosynthesis